MGFGEAIRVGLRKCASFGGRAGRAEYWWWVLFSTLVIIGWTFVDMAVFGVSTGPFSTLVTVALLLPGIAATARRLHDTGRSGWWILLPIAPIALILPALAAPALFLVMLVAAALIGFVLVLLMVVGPGFSGPNRFGPEPE